MTTDTRPKPFVFVLMPLSGDFDDVYRFGIQQACDAAGAYAERVDEQIFDESILRRIYNQIAKADLIVSDMSGRNANVFYETGYAHALGKTVILLTRDVNDIPFDLKHYPHIVYSGRATEVRDELERRVRYFTQHASAAVYSATAVTVHVNDVAITASPVVRISLPYDRTFGADFKIDIHNTVVRDIRTLACEVGLIAPRMFSSAIGDGGDPLDRVILERGRVLYYSASTYQLLPGAWRTFRVRATVEGQLPEPATVLPFVVTISTQSGVWEHNFDTEIVVQ